MRRDGQFSSTGVMDAPSTMQDYPSQQPTGSSSALVPVGGSQMLPMPGAAPQPWQLVQQGMMPPIYIQMQQPVAAPQPQPAPAAAEEKSIILSVADLMDYLRRHWLKGLLLALPLAAVTFAYLGLGKKIYEAETKVMISIRDSSGMDFGTGGGTGLSELSAPQIINNHKSRITSRRYIDYLYTKLDRKIIEGYLQGAGELGMKGRLMLSLGLSDPPKATPPEILFAQRLTDGVRVDSIKESHLLRVAIRDYDPTRAADLANAYAQSYVTYLSDDARLTTHGTSEALDKELRDALTAAKADAEALQLYQQQQDLIKGSEGSSGLGAQKAESISKAVTDAEVAVTMLEAELTSLRAAQSSGMVSVIPGIGSDAGMIDLRKQASDVQSKLSEWSQTCGRNHPKIIGFRETLASNAQQQSQRVLEIIQEKENLLTASKAKAEQLKSEAQLARNMARDENQKNIELRFLMDKANASQELARQLAQRKGQTDLVGRIGAGGNVSVADIAVPPDSAISPKKSIAAVAALLVFGLVGAGLPLGLGFTQDKLWPLLKQSAQQLPSSQQPTSSPPAPSYSSTRSSGLPGTEPLPPQQQHIMMDVEPMMEPMPPPIIHGSAAAPVRSPTTGNSPAPILASIPELFSSEPAMQFTELLHPDPMGGPSVIASICRTLEQSRSPQQGPRIILTTSATTGEGKSIIAASMAASLCTSGAKVLLMECNPSAPSLTNWFPQAENFSAMAHDLSALRYGLSNLFILPANDLPSIDMRELIPGYRRWMERAYQEVEWIILDGASLLMGFADMAQLAPLATDILFVHDATRCSQEQVKAGFNLLRPITRPDRIRGMVMNRHSLVSA